MLLRAGSEACRWREVVKWMLADAGQRGRGC